VEIEFHRLDLRYEALRKRSPHREKQLLSSLAEAGQLFPVVVVSAVEADRYVLLDGYKRVRALRRLAADAVRSTVWTLDEAEALLLERVMRSADPDGALEEGWLLCELRDRFGLSLTELARRFDRTPSWVSRRLSLVAELPASVQEHVRQGTIPAHAAMRYLVPLARAKAADCERLAAAIAPSRLSSRQIAEISVAWMSGSEATRDRLLAQPILYLRAQEEARRPEAKSPARMFLDDLEILGAVARRASRRMRQGILQRLLPPERDEVVRCAAQAKGDIEVFFRRWDQEVTHA
jgi:ParB-like chromosome segregation protein Spo0J